MKKTLLYLAFLLLSFSGFAQADIKVINTNYQDVYVPGSTVVYTVSVMNFGPSVASNVRVVNALPSGIFDFKWTGPVNPVTSLNVSGSNNQLDHTIATLAVGEVVNYTIKIKVPNSYSVNLVNETVISGPNVDPDPVCLQCKDIDVKGVGADILVTNTNNQNYYTPGTTSVYTLKVKNNGPLKAVNVNVFSAIPAGITNFSWTGSNGSVGTNVNLSNSIFEIAKDASVTYTITLDIPIGFTGNLVNLSSVTSTSTTPDPNLTNNSFSETDLPFPTTGSDIVITNTDNKAGYNPGGTNTYLVKVKNNGPEPAANLQITNAIPAGITQFSWTGDNGSSGTNVALDNTIGTLAVGAEVLYTIVLQVPLTRLTDLTSETVLTSTNVDPNPNNSQYVDTDVLINTADVSVINTNNQAVYIHDGTSVYTITVKNNGPHNAANVKIVNAIPAGITQFSWTGSNGSSGTNAALNNTITNLLNGDTVIYTVTLQVPLTYTGNLTSTVVQTSATFDPTACTQCVDIDAQAANTSADVVATNSNSTTGYTIGETKNYVLTVRNNGPSDATNVVVTNPIPTGITQFSWTGNAGSGTNVGLNNTIPLLLVGQSITYNITLVVPAGFTGDIVSQASTTSTTIDPNVECANCIDIDSNAVIGGIKVVNTDNNTSYIAGQARTYTITVTNNGPTTATNIVIQDLVSNGLSQSNVTWSGNATSGTGDLNDTIATLPAGQTVTYTIIVNIPSNYNQNTSLINQVTFTSATPTSNPTCLQCLDIDTPNPSADLVISKSDNRPDFLLSQNGNIENNVYTIVIANNGPSDAVNVLVSDMMPPGITVMSWSSSNGKRGTGSMNDLVPSIAAGSVLTYSVTLEMPTVYNPPNPANPLQALVNLTNTVTVTSPTPDPSINCPKCTDIDVPRPDYVTVLNTSADLTVTKLIKEILINSPCIETSNFSASAPISFGYFNSNNSDFPIKDGVIIRNGIAKNTEGKASSAMTISTVGSDVTDTDLSAINVANGNTASINDASFVKFNFKPANDVFSFNFLFASNEYGQYQCGFSDAFAFILTDVLTGVKTNLAVVPSTTTPISVTSIRNAQYNGTCASVNSSYFGKYNLNTPGNPNAEADSSIAMRGQTVKMTASAPVIPNKEYSIKLVIGDYIDTAFDSAVFIEAGSFKLGEPEIKDIIGNPGSATLNIQNCSGDPQVITASPNMIPGVAYSWKKDGIEIPGETLNTLLASEVGTYTVTFTYAGGCSQSDDIVITPFEPIVQNAIDLVSPFNVVAGGGVFNLTQIEAAVIGNLPSTSFNFTYYLNQSDFDNNNAIQDPTSFIGTDLQDIIYSYETTLSNVECRPKLKFRLFAPLQPVGTFEYTLPTGETGFCRTPITSSITPTTPTGGIPLTSGGVYSIEPNNGIIIDPQTGAIDLKDAIPGDYTVKYKIIATGNNIPYEATAPLKIILCTDLAPLTTVCGGASLTLTTSDAGSGATYTWSDATPTVIGTTTLPELTNVIAPTAGGTYAYSVVASYGTFNSVSSSESLTVNAVAEATITTTTPGVCNGVAGTITITGQADNIVKYTIDGGAPIQITIEADGTNDIDVTPAIPQSIYRLVSAERNLTPNCPQTFTIGSPGSFVTITPDGPNASIGILNPNPNPICQNGSTTVTISGNAGATVNYKINNGTPLSITLTAAGVGLIPTNALTANTTYELISITDNSGTLPCTKTFAAGAATATVSVNPLPTITGFSTSTAFICIGTKGKLTFTGTPNSTIVYSDGTSNYSVVLNAAGTTTPSEIDTPNNLTANTVFSLVSITTNDALLCNSIIFTLPNIEIKISNGPSITAQPAATTTLCEGGTAADLIVTAIGASLTYEWKDETNSVVGNASTLSVPAILSNNGKSYACTITDACGVTVISNSATVNVTAKPVFNPLQPTGASPICAGADINLTATTTSNIGVTYKWFRGTTDLSLTNPTALTNNLIITNAQTTDGGDYTCVATTCSSVSSLSKTVTVNPLPTVSNFYAANASICTGTKGNLIFKATPNAIIVYSDGTPNTFIATTDAFGDANVFTTNNLTVPTTFTLVSITNNFTSCFNTTFTNISPVIIGINAPPTVSDPTPSTTLICSGDPATTLSVVATGAGLSYVWKKGNTDLANSNSSSVTVPSVSANTGDYTCTITDICGLVVTSNKASLIINDAPIVTQAPIGDTICSGTTLNLSIATTGTGLTYQWKRNGVDLPITNLTATTSNLVIVNAQTTDSGDYTCEAKSGTCSVTSPIALMTVNQAPQVITQPESKVYCTGDDITLSVGVSIPTVTYQWQLNGTNLPEETNFELKLTSVTTANSGDYVCLIDNSPCKQIKSNKAVILVKAPPVATIQTTNTTVCAGTDSNLIFNGTPNAVVTYTVNGANQVLNLSPSGTATIITTGILETTTTYQLVSVSTNDFSPVCTSALTLTDPIKIDVLAIPEPTLALDGFICIDENNVTLRKFKMETGFSASQYSFQWYENNVALLPPRGTSDFYDADKAATYKVEITDANGCKRSATTKITSSLQPKTVTATVLSGYFDDNATIEITAVPTNGDYEYQLDNGPFQDSNIFTNVPRGTHNVYARDKRECNTTPAFSVPIVNYPKFFTPNGDGINDTWKISSLFVQSNAKIYIFDRFGKLMKQISTTGDGWDGNFNGSPAQADDYWFIIKYEEQQINKEFKAHFTLKR